MTQHSGFKGSRVGVNNVIIEESRISFSIIFVDSEGVTHGTMRHALPLDGESDVSMKAEELMKVLISRAASMHFTNPSGADPLTSGATGGGIAESLGVSTPPTDEPDGAQG